jgi:hypothetical protein
MANMLLHLPPHATEPVPSNDLPGVDLLLLPPVPEARNVPHHPPNRCQVTVFRIIRSYMSGNYNRGNWSRQVPNSQAYRRAGGRRKWNAERKLKAQLRQQEMARLLGSGRAYTLSDLASLLGCGISTAWRDKQSLTALGCCPTCGHVRRAA